jgi:hypothetical protein
MAGAALRVGIHLGRPRELPRRGELQNAEEPAREIVEYYIDNKDSIQVAAFLGVAASLLLVFFVGRVVFAVGFAVDITILIALSEAADEIDPVAVQSLQALWDNVFVPQALGGLMFLWATGAGRGPHRSAAQVARLGHGRARRHRPHATWYRRTGRRCHLGARPSASCCPCGPASTQRPDRRRRLRHAPASREME